MNFDLRLPLGRLQFAIHRALTFVSIGLESAPSEVHAIPKMPDVPFGLRFTGLEEWTTKKAVDEYRTWLLANGLRAVVEALGLFLDDIHRFLAAMTLFEGRGRNVTITAGELQRAMDQEPKRFHKRGFPAKLEHVESTYGVALDSALVPMVRSVNAARNCLVHRGGIVSDKDLGESGKLVVRWRRLAIFVTGEGGERRLDPPMALEAGAQVAARNEDVEKVFGRGERLEFSAEEFSGICWFLYRCCVDLSQSVHGKAQSAGLIEPADKPQAE